jgi:ribonuclease HIII
LVGELLGRLDAFNHSCLDPHQNPQRQAPARHSSEAPVEIPQTEPQSTHSDHSDQFDQSDQSDQSEQSDQSNTSASRDFNHLVDLAVELVNKSVYDFLSPPAQVALQSAVGLLELVREHELELPAYDILLTPFTKVFEDYLLQFLAHLNLLDSPKNSSAETFELVVDGLERLLRKAELYVGSNDGVVRSIICVYQAYFNDAVSPEANMSSEQISPAQINSVQINSLQDLRLKIYQICFLINESYRSFFHDDFPEESNETDEDDLAREAQKNEQAEYASESADSSRFSAADSTSPSFFLTSSAKAKTDKSLLTKPINAPKVRIGTDESGKGDYFGSLVIAGVYVDEGLGDSLASLGVQDSKKNTDAQNMMLAAEIKKVLGADNYEIIAIEPKQYNELYEKEKNLNRLLALGHARVIENILARVECDYVIIDQFANEKYILNALEPMEGIQIFQTPKAERDIAVAAASVLARDAFIKNLKSLGESLEITLLKGAGSQVDDLARKIVEKFGHKALRKLVKLHFNNTQKIQNRAF